MRNHYTSIPDLMLSIIGFGTDGGTLQRRNVILKFSGENCVSIAEAKNCQQVRLLESPLGGNLPPIEISDWAVIVYA